MRNTINISLYKNGDYVRRVFFVNNDNECIKGRFLNAPGRTYNVNELTSNLSGFGGLGTAITTFTATENSLRIVSRFSPSDPNAGSEVYIFTK